MFSLVGIIAQSLLQYFDTVLWVTGRHPVGKNTEHCATYAQSSLVRRLGRGNEVAKVHLENGY